MTYQEITVYLNKSPEKYTRGYIENDVLVQSIQFYVDPGLSDLEICEATFQALNAPEPNGIGNLTPTKIAVYHRVFPSLSTGDVVDIDNRRYAVENLGWTRLSDTRGLGLCALCRKQRILIAYGIADICADCLQGDPAEDLAEDLGHYEASR